MVSLAKEKQDFSQFGLFSSTVLLGVIVIVLLIVSWATATETFVDFLSLIFENES